MLSLHIYLRDVQKVVFNSSEDIQDSSATVLVSTVSSRSGGTLSFEGLGCKLASSGISDVDKV